MVSFASGRLVGRLLLSKALDRIDEPVAQSLDLRGDEGVIVELAAETRLP